MIRRTDLWVLAGAVLALGANIALAFLPLANGRGLVTLALAALEAAPIAWWWMGLHRSGATTRLSVLVPLAALAFLVALVLADRATRQAAAPPW